MWSFKRVPLVIALSLAAAAAVGNTAAQAQTPATKTAPVVQVDRRFSQWVGCWRLENDLVGSGIRVCVIPDKVFNVRIETLAGAQRGEIETLVPDNVAHAIVDPTCKGTERSEWSKDGERVFRFADVQCGDDAARKLSSVIFLADGPVLVEVQHVGSGVDQNVRVKRYRRALDQSLPDGTIAPQPSIRAEETSIAGSWDIADVIEASGKIPGDAVQAALTEVDKPFDVNKKTLVAMADAKVDAGVIDLMVALTYPRKLQVQRSGGGGGGGDDMGMMGLAIGGPMYDPFYSPIIPANCFSTANYAYYANYGGQCGWYYGSRYGYSPYGYYSGLYSGYGYYPYYGNGGSWVPVGPSTPGTPTTPTAEGRVINGRGYTQIRPREPDPAPVAGRSNGNSGSSGSNGATNSGSSGASSSGYSSGSSSGGGSSSGSSGGERTAVTRPPGGGF